MYYSQLNLKNIFLLFPLLNLFLFLNLCPQQILISDGFELLSECQNLKSLDNQIFGTEMESTKKPIIEDDTHRSIDKRSSEEYEEFIKGGGRFPMGFGKRSTTFSNNFERNSFIPGRNTNWVIRPFIYGINPIPREWRI
ncbi:hypothetical protein Mgra_00001711 [Meloidogyne graminicola]|uniref:Uncharacterized protein n=1 Tax=Meloidogyne graminicola TaxID=189291 RepID=A0A8T0A027_9BILA|nr:hypothetical protein Mgra_00001711 [Meloidogyne graminicola]